MCCPGVDMRTAELFPVLLEGMEVVVMVTAKREVHRTLAAVVSWHSLWCAPKPAVIRFLEGLHMGP